MMAQRQVSSRTIKQVWSFLFSKCTPQNQVVKSGLNPLPAVNTVKLKVPDSEKLVPFSGISSSNYASQVLSEKNKGFIDLFTNNVHKQIYLPTISVNKLKVYEDLTSLKTILDPAINNIKIIDAPVPGKPQKKEAVTMILIRRRKMRKHKLRKFRKKFRFVLAKIKMKRDLRKEQAFRTELLSQIEAAEKFDAKSYVDNVLNSIRYQPHVETVEEIKARYREIMKMNKYKTMFIRPKFDDD